MTRRSKLKDQSSKIKKTTIVVIASLLLVFCSLSLIWWFRGWEGKAPAQVMVITDHDLWILSVRPKERRLVEIKVPGNTSIPVGSHGVWPARSLLGLSALETDDRLLWSVGQDVLGVPVDGIIQAREWSGVRTTSFSRLVLDGLDELRHEFRCIRTKCSMQWWSLPEMMRLVAFAHGLRPQEFQAIDLGTTKAARRVVDPSGTEHIEIDQELLSPLVQLWFRIDEFRTSGLTVALRVPNSGEISGKKAGRLFENLGLRVISVGTTDQTDQQILVQNRAMQGNEIVKLLSHWIHLPILIGTFDERADVLVVF